MKLFQPIFIVLSALLFLSACQGDANENLYEDIALDVKLPKLHDSEVQVDDVKTNSEFTATDSLIKDKAEQMYLALTAELYNRLDAPTQSAKSYQKLVNNSDDVAVARRATILAATNDQSNNALLNAQAWVSLQYNDLEANQYLALLLLRNNKFVEAATQLGRIEQLVVASETASEKESFKSLRFIGALLSVESHHKKALQVFTEYLKLYAQNATKIESDVESQAKIQVQQQLILASLANQADNHDVVISSLNQLDSYVTHEAIESKSYIKASVMKAKALKSVKRVSDAVQTLKPVVDEHDASDSVKLELVRLLIMNKQKDTAFTYLKALTVKHPKNNDLLKSLIALEIDQSNYKGATKNIQKLKASAGYSSDAEYFMAEVFEAQGDTKSALEKYMNVTSGSLLKNAKKKVARLSKQLALESESQKVNFKRPLHER